MLLLSSKDLSQQEGNGPIDFGQQGLWKIVQILVASKAQFDLRFETSNLDYPGIHVHIASNSHFGGL